jgi:hypothetical protein
MTPDFVEVAQVPAEVLITFEDERSYCLFPDCTSDLPHQ